MKSLMCVIAAIFITMEVAKAELAPFAIQFEIVCDKTSAVTNVLEKKYNEQAVMIAPSKNDNGEDLYHALWVNTENSTWTFIVANRQKDVSCVIASGKDFSLRSPSGI